MLARFSMWLLTRMGWTILANFPEEKKYVVIAAPHTSNWDFLIGRLYAWALRMDVKWLGKHTLFRWPLGWFFQAIGGTPVRRESGSNYIAQLTKLFEQSEELVLALAPEGTRSKTDHWKTGFYYIARAANVPIALGYLDFGKKEAGIGDIFYPGDDIHADFEEIRKLYSTRRGKNPDNASLIRVRPR